MVMALDYGAGGCEFKLRRFQNIFDLMERFDENGLKEETTLKWIIIHLFIQI